MSSRMRSSAGTELDFVYSGAGSLGTPGVNAIWPLRRIKSTDGVHEARTDPDCWTEGRFDQTLLAILANHQRRPTSRKRQSLKNSGAFRSNA